MSRPLLIVTVALASYALFNIACSIGLAIAWRTRLANRNGGPSTQRARALIQLRTVPVLAPVAITALLIVPAFVIFEPVKSSELVGPLVLALAAIASMQVTAAVTIALATTWRTSAAARQWLRGSAPLEVQPPAGVPAYVIDSMAPIVALVGVFKPKLIAARSVIEACSSRELNAIVAHERGHLHSRDNLKRWLMACAPDALRWTPIHHEIANAWHDAAEDAADDAATANDAALRLDLAQLIVKIARLAPGSAWREVTVSPFVDPSGLNRRVRRLLVERESLSASRASRTRRAALLLIAAAALSMVLQPPALEQLYLATEALIRLGR
jgi:Zn-dependent protease with chaperone function